MFNYNSTMKLNTNNGVSYLTFNELSKYSFINHAFSTRLGGVSENEFSSMNLSFNRGDPDENVLENYKRLCKAAGFDFNTLVASAQDHNTNIRDVTSNDLGIGIWKEKDQKSVDGLITNKPGVTLVTYFADCTPLFFLDPYKKVIGLAHAGWRGTVSLMANKMVEKMCDQYGCNVNDIICGIGPSIGPCCYEVDKPVYDEFCSIPKIDHNLIAADKENGKYIVSLWDANKQILLQSGIRQSNIIVGGVCTSCNSDLLFSHRRTKGKRGGMVAMMSIQE